MLHSSLLKSFHWLLAFQLLFQALLLPFPQTLPVQADSAVFSTNPVETTPQFSLKKEEAGSHADQPTATVPLPGNYTAARSLAGI